MEYKYRKGQIFGKRLQVPKSVLNKVYEERLSFEEFLQYELEGKIPVSCLAEEDRKIIEKFGIEKAKTFDWELLGYYADSRFKDALMGIEVQTEDVNMALYELAKDQIKPSDYTDEMKKVYAERLFDLGQETDDELADFKRKFNDGEISLGELIENWEVVKEKDLSYCLLNDEKNENHITDSDLKEFMTRFATLAPLIEDIGTCIKEVVALGEEDKQEYMRHITDTILSNDYTYLKKLTNEEYREIFQYSSLEEHLKLFNYGHVPEELLEELKMLPEDYIFQIPIPFSVLQDSQVLTFINIYGLQNVVDFDNECGHFFTKNNCEMLQLMFEMYIHYGGNTHNPDRTIFTKKRFDENGKYVDRPYTKDEFYEAMRRMILYGPTNSNYVKNAPDYRSMTGEFQKRNSELFISEEAPEELQRLFYTKSLTPNLLIEHPEYMTYLEGKDLSSCFKAREVKIIGSDAYGEYQNLYQFLSNKTDFKGVMRFITEYSDILDIVFNKNYQKEIQFSAEDKLPQIQQVIDVAFKEIIIEKGVSYPKRIPQSIKKSVPSLFLPSTAPRELQEAFYDRIINTEFILSNSKYRKYLENVDLETIYSYMPVSVVREDYGYSTKNLISMVKQTFGAEDSLDIMLLYGKYIESVFEANQFKNWKGKSNPSKRDLLNEIGECILQAIKNGEIQYDENMPTYFKSKNPTLFLNSTVPEDIRRKFYHREFTINDFMDNPELLEMFEKTNIGYGFSKDIAWVIPLFENKEDLKEANQNRLNIISSYYSIQDMMLQRTFKEYVVEFSKNISVDKLEYISRVLSELSLSNSSEIYTFRKELAVQILNSPNPMESLNKIEDIFIKNIIPTFGKVYSCFEILHPNFKGFQFDNTMVSPVLRESTNIQRKVIVFSDLIKASFGSNNRSVLDFLENVEVGNGLYEKIKKGEVSYESLNGEEKKELARFSRILSTLYNNSMKNRRNDRSFSSTGDVMQDLAELSQRLSPDGSLDYRLRR
ncbi:MAG: hypothetical protein IJ867_04895 [Clostridia bacterium]|nr:hypothetical protein [Clostridia bacterium]